uniref:Uncharacterized protein n=1 Tax=Cajanus cajan TaxID=3821 RepID=A0A151S5L8_CAJCA|nr:hypothetical protein KK1_028203 [Cajanus cajan]
MVGGWVLRHSPSRIRCFWTRISFSSEIKLTSLLKKVFFCIEYEDDNKLKPYCFIKDSVVENIGYCFYMVKFDLPTNREKAITEGPYMEYYEDNVLLALATRVGKPLKVDHTHPDPPWNFRNLQKHSRRGLVMIFSKITRC